MSKSVIYKKGIDGIARIGKALLGRETGTATLHVSGGGLANRNKEPWMKFLFDTDVYPFISTSPIYTKTGLIGKGVNPHERSVIEGKIVCDFLNGIINSSNGMIRIGSMNKSWQEFLSQQS